MAYKYVKKPRFAREMGFTGVFTGAKKPFISTNY
jgi:hypothetical protein